MDGDVVAGPAFEARQPHRRRRSGLPDAARVRDGAVAGSHVQSAQPCLDPATTAVAVTVILWLVGVAFALGLASIWSRRGWTPGWLPPLLVVGSVTLPLASWFFAAVSCGL